MFDISYSSIKDAVVYDFDEYVNEENLTPRQVSAKIIEEGLRRVNYNSFTKSSYFINIAIESFKLGEIADYIFDKIEECEQTIEATDENSEDDISQFNKDLAECKKLKETASYKVIETDYGWKLDYLLNQKDD